MTKVTFFPLLNFALLFVTTPQHTGAANDWSKPCFGGVCSYDLPMSSNGSSGTLKIWGADTAIADITPAANWEIIGCDPGTLEQDIRIVCRGGNDDSAFVNERAVANTTSFGAPQPSASVPPGAAALPSDGKEQGAVGKIVRLPENCGKQPFARIAQAWIPVDQTIPSDLARRFVRRVNSTSGTPTVKALRLDVNFGATDVTKTGPVNFALVGANVPGAAATGDLDPSNLTPPSGNLPSTTDSAVRRSRIYRPRFDLNKSQALKPIDVDKTVTLLDKSLTCGTEGKNVNAKLNIGAEAKAHAIITVGLAASGSVFPPKVTSIGITSSMTADLDGTITVSAGVGGTLDSGKIKIFEVGIPGLDFPGVLSIGPTFEVNGQAKASLDLDVDMNVGLSYHIENVQFTFPKGRKQSGTFSPKDTPLKLTAQPSGTATGSVEAHIIPSLNLGINALAGLASAGVFVDLDASASMTLTVDATGAEKTAIINPRALDTPPSQKYAAVIQSQGHPEDRSTAVIRRGTGMIGEHYFTQRAPQPFGFGDIVDGVKDAASTVKDKVSSAASTVKDKVSSAASAVKNKVTGTATAAADKVKSAVKTLTGDNDKPAPKPAATGTKVAAQQQTTTKAKAPTSTKPATSTKSTPPATSNNTKVEVKAPPPPAPAQGNNASFGGCFKVGAALDVNVGADADFFGLFNADTSLSLFSKKFQLFKKCFGDANARRSVDTTPVRRQGKLEARALTCNAETAGEPTEVANETVPAAKIV